MTVSDFNSGLQREELWRADDNNGTAVNWANVATQNVIGNGPFNMAFRDVPSNTGAFWYGTHVFNQAGNMAIEPFKIRVTVTQPNSNPILDANPVSMRFAATQGGASPIPQNINVTNLGGGTLTWAAQKNSSWLALSGGQGSNSGSISVSANPANLAPGTYNDIVSITAPNAQGSPFSVGVTLNVDPSTASTPTLSSSNPSNLAVGGPPFNLTLNGSGFTTQSTVLWNGTEHPTTLITSTQVSTAVSAGDVANPGNSSVVVSNGTLQSNPLIVPVVTVPPSDFAFAPASSTVVAIPAGQTASYTLGVMSGSNFFGAINFNCNGAPQNATCSVSPQQIIMSAGTTQFITVTVKTARPSSSAGINLFSMPRLFPLALLPFIGAICCMFLLTRRRVFLRFLAPVSLGLCAIFLLSCGGNSQGNSNSSPSSPNPSPSNTTAVITVSANSPTGTHNFQLTLTIQQ